MGTENQRGHRHIDDNQRGIYQPFLRPAKPFTPRAKREPTESSPRYPAPGKEPPAEAETRFRQAAASSVPASRPKARYPRRRSSGPVRSATRFAEARSTLPAGPIATGYRAFARRSRWAVSTASALPENACSICSTTSRSISATSTDGIAARTTAQEPGIVEAPPRRVCQLDHHDSPFRRLFTPASIRSHAAFIRARTTSPRFVNL